VKKVQWEFILEHPNAYIEILLEMAMHQPIPQGWIWEQSNSIYDGSGMAIFLPRLKL